MRTLLLTLCVVFLWACEPTPLAPGAMKFDPLKEHTDSGMKGLEYRIVGELRNVIDAPSGITLDGYFEDLNVRGNKACASVKARKGFSPTLWKRYSGPIAKLTSGCYTFFTMNDRDSHLSFEKVKRMYPGSYNCHTVGFSQFYIMHERITCSTLTAIDVNWRIMWGHYQLLRAFDTGTFDLRKIKAEPGLKTSLNTFCYERNQDMCMYAFLNASAKIRLVRKIDLQLSFLHDMEFQTDADNVLLYISNAIDPGYSTRRQFDRLLWNLTRAISPGQKGIVVYHGGGTDQFAIYEVTKNEEGYSSVGTACRDDLRWSPFYVQRGKRIRTFFDEVSITKKAKPCNTGLLQ